MSDAEQSASATIARMMAQTYKTLRAEGLPEEVALDLTKEWLHTLYGQTAGARKEATTGGLDLSALMKMGAKS